MLRCLYVVKTSEIMVDTITGLIAQHITIDDTVTVTGVLKPSSIEMTTADGLIQSHHWGDVSTPGMLLRTTSTSTIIGICSGSKYGVWVK